ncbi:arginase family protein [Tatumella sp. OPLPL6]|uniref:arginase family protein n=1 Tax=Tatumella sp. OPLPL6 TaxID=1928657 RepID=UPI000C1850F9|nr:arginase family protein [Tatumella sp. OPLPL6]PIJ43153.1 arginase [Tatumella sp. OPLPL6]
MDAKTLRLSFPQWQGGNNPPYRLGAQLLSFLAPDATGPVEEVTVSEPTGEPLTEVEGIMAKPQLLRQLGNAQQIIDKHRPDAIVVLGGDCLVSLAPFSYLLEKYQDKLGVLWIDSHPDVQTPKQFSHAHAYVLGALLGTGDPSLVDQVSTKLLPEKVMIAGIHHPSAYERDYLEHHKIATFSPQQIKQGTDTISEWIAKEEIEFLAIHLDLDVLDPRLFRSVLFAEPEQSPHKFDGIAQGQLSIEDVLKVITAATSTTQTVGLTIAEHMPWDMLNLQKMLRALPLMT